MITKECNLARLQTRREEVTVEISNCDIRRARLGFELDALEAAILLEDDPPTWKNTLQGCGGDRMSQNDAFGTARKFNYKFMLWNDRVYLVGAKSGNSKGTKFLRGFLDKDGSKEIDDQVQT